MAIMSLLVRYCLASSKYRNICERHLIGAHVQKNRIKAAVIIHDLDSMIVPRSFKWFWQCFEGERKCNHAAEHLFSPYSSASQL